MVSADFAVLGIAALLAASKEGVGRGVHRAVELVGLVAGVASEAAIATVTFVVHGRLMGLLPRAVRRQPTCAEGALAV